MFILLHQEATIEQTLFILKKDTSFSGLFSPECLRQFGLLLVGFSKRLDGCAMTRDLLLEFDPLDCQVDPTSHCLRHSLTLLLVKVLRVCKEAKF